MNIPPPDPYKLSTSDDGSRHAVGDVLSLTVLPDGRSRVFHRNAIKKHMGNGDTEHIRWLVAELDGVRVYVDGSRIVVTKRDLYP